jgi:uncharacterized delta-60 repeat protein
MKPKVIIFLGLCSFFKGQSQTGNLDNTFDGDGIVTTAIGTVTDIANDVAVQPDGKIVVVGRTFSGHSNFCIVRYNPNGSLDNTFDTDGKVTTDFSGKEDKANCVAIQTDGKIVVGGSSKDNANIEHFALARYNTDGSLDNTFSGDGKATFELSNEEDAIEAIAIHQSGRIFAAGYVRKGDNYNAAIIRLHPDGGLDPLFNGNAPRIVNLGQTTSYLFGIAIHVNSKIVVSGTADNGWLVARFEYNGSLDNTFGTNGVVINALSPSSDVGYAVAIQTDGKIVVGGYSSNGSNNDFAVLRYTTEGILDNTFSGDGIQFTPIGTARDEAADIALQPDGKILLAGTAEINGKSNFAIARYNSNGSLDNTFSDDGIQTTSIGGQLDEAQGVAMQPDGKIIVAGFSTLTNNDFSVVRYISGLKVGTIDFSLDKNSVVVYPNPIKDQAFLDYTLIKDEKITVTLHDLQGKLLKVFVENAVQLKGLNTVNLNFPTDLPMGNYLITIASQAGQMSVGVCH